MQIPTRNLSALEVWLDATHPETLAEYDDYCNAPFDGVRSTRPIRTVSYETYNGAHVAEPTATPTYQEQLDAVTSVDIGQLLSELSESGVELEPDVRDTLETAAYQQSLARQGVSYK